MKFRILLAFALLLVCHLSQAQQLSVTSFTKLDDLDARVNEPRTDQNGEKCAIIKVVTTETGFSFDCGQLGVTATVQKTAEVWVYVPRGVRKLKIAHPQLGQLATDDGYYWFPTGGVEAATSYRLALESGRIDRTFVPSAPQAGWLVINSTPSEADVYLRRNGTDEFVGTTPYSEKVPFGSYNYTLKKAMYHDEHGLANIQSVNDNKAQDVVLQPAFGHLKITSSPSGARVTIDGQTKSYLTPCTTDALPSGTYTVRASLDKYSPLQRQVTVSDGKTTDIALDLSARFAQVSIQSTDGAAIYVDGERKGLGSVLCELVEGPHDIEARLEHHHAATKRISVKAMQPQDVELHPVAKYGSLDVNSRPLGARVFVEGKDHGKTPLTIERLLEGSHEVRLVKDGCAPATLTVAIEENKTASIDQTLVTGMDVSITSEPEGADVFVDNHRHGVTPLTLQLDFGRHTIKVVNGKMEKQQDIEIAENGRTNYHFDVVNGKTVSIVASESRASISIDGKAAGTGTVTQKLEYGQHKLQAQHNGKVCSESLNFAPSSPDRIVLSHFTYPGITFVTLHAIALNAKGAMGFGVSAGTVKKVGFFASAMSNFNMQGFNADLTAASINGEVDGVTPYYDGTTAISRISITAGLLVRLAKPACLKLGAGYGANVLSARTTQGQWVKQSTYSYSGLDLTAGLTFCFGHFALDFGTLSTNFQTLEVSAGIGYVF